MIMAVPGKVQYNFSCIQRAQLVWSGRAMGMCNCRCWSVLLILPIEQGTAVHAAGAG